MSTDDERLGVLLRAIRRRSELTQNSQKCGTGARAAARESIPLPEDLISLQKLEMGAPVTADGRICVHMCDFQTI